MKVIAWTLIALIPLILTAWARNQYHEREVLQLEEEISRNYAVERPALDAMCAQYFRWAADQHQSVPGMEKDCAAYPSRRASALKQP